MAQHCILYGMHGFHLSYLWLSVAYYMVRIAYLWLSVAYYMVRIAYVWPSVAYYMVRIAYLWLSIAYYMVRYLAYRRLDCLNGIAYRSRRVLVSHGAYSLLS